MVESSVSPAGGPTAGAGAASEDTAPATAAASATPEGAEKAAASDPTAASGAMTGTETGAKTDGAPACADAAATNPAGTNGAAITASSATAAVAAEKATAAATTPNASAAITAERATAAASVAAGAGTATATVTAAATAAPQPESAANNVVGDKVPHVCPDFDVELRQVRHRNSEVQVKLQEELARVRATVTQAQNRAAATEAARIKCSALRAVHQQLEDRKHSAEVLARAERAAETREDLITRLSEEDVKLAPGLPDWLLQHGLPNKEAAALKWCKRVSAVCIDDVLSRFDGLEEGNHLESFAAVMKLNDKDRVDFLGDLLREREQRMARRKRLGFLHGRRVAVARTKMRLLEGVLGEYSSSVTQIERELKECNGGFVVRDRLLERLDHAKAELRSMRSEHQTVSSALETCNVVWVVVSAPTEDLQGHKLADRLINLANKRSDILTVPCTWSTAKGAQRVDRLKFEEVANLSAKWRTQGMPESILEQIGTILRSTLWFQLYTAVVKAALHTATRIGSQTVVKVVCIMGGPVSRFESKEMPALVQEVLTEIADVSRRAVAAMEVAPFVSLAVFQEQLKAQATGLTLLDDGQMGAEHPTGAAPKRPPGGSQNPTQSKWLKELTPRQRPEEVESQLKLQVARLRRELWDVSSARDAAREEIAKLQGGAAAESAELRRGQLQAHRAAETLRVHRDDLRRDIAEEHRRGIMSFSDAELSFERTLSPKQHQHWGGRQGTHDLRRGQDVAFTTRKDDRLRQALLRSHSHGSLGSSLRHAPTP